MSVDVIKIIIYEFDSSQDIRNTNIKKIIKENYPYDVAAKIVYGSAILRYKIKLFWYESEEPYWI